MLGIRHRASLVLFLIDNITGKEIPAGGATFYINDRKVRPESKARAIYVFLDLPDGEMELVIDVYGYEQVCMTIFVDSQKGPQEQTVFLIPDHRYTQTISYRIIEGVHAGIEEIEAVRLQREICNYKGIEERKRILYIYGHRGKEFKQIPYALIDEDSMTYETIKILRHINDEEIKVEAIPQKSYKAGDKINRICQGQVYPDGRYVIKLADEGKEKYIIKYEDTRGVHFTLLDFEETEPFQLE